MHLFLIRHGETEHNVAGLLAGVTDSNLTNHGVLQAQRLGKYLITTRNLKFSRLYASDLKRAWMTANEIHKAQTEAQTTQPRHNDGTSAVVLPSPTPPLSEVVQLAVLREQDFGSLELVAWSSKRNDDFSTPRPQAETDPDFKPKETKDAMKRRADEFLNDFIVPILALSAFEANQEDGAAAPTVEETIAVVSHGLFLSALWRALLGRFHIKDVILDSEAGIFGASRPIEHLPGWSNTGFLELSIMHRQPDIDNESLIKSSDDAQEPPTDIITQAVIPQSTEKSFFSDFTLTILAINGKDHLQNLKRTRGVGSATYDIKQTNIEGFFKKAKIRKSRPSKQQSPVL